MISTVVLLAEARDGNVHKRDCLPPPHGHTVISALQRETAKVILGYIMNLRPVSKTTKH